MIVDSSAMIAIVRKESESASFIELLAHDRSSVMSAASYLETAIIVDAGNDPTSSRDLDEVLYDLEITVLPVSVEQARIARAAYRDFGKGSGSRARLNFGDCFSYALAAELRQPLLYKGTDFGHTDIESALD